MKTQSNPSREWAAAHICEAVPELVWQQWGHSDILTIVSLHWLGWAPLCPTLSSGFTSKLTLVAVTILTGQEISLAPPSPAVLSLLSFSSQSLATVTSRVGRQRVSLHQASGSLSLSPKLPNVDWDWQLNSFCQTETFWHLSKGIFKFQVFHSKRVSTESCNYLGHDK